jgi:hypothetical protein
MANNNRPSINKRNREQARKDRNSAKQQRRSERAVEKENRGPLAPGEDPDIASIVPGPQRPIWEQ